MGGRQRASRGVSHRCSRRGPWALSETSFPTGCGSCVRSRSVRAATSPGGAHGTRSLSVWGAQYPPHRGLTSMIDSAGTPELAMDVDRLVGCSAGPAIEIAQRYSRTATVRQWKAAIWTVNGDPIGIPDAASIITIVDDGDYGSDYDYQLVSASTAALMDPFLHPEPSFLWSDDETLFLEVQPETGWIEVYSTGPDLVEEVRSDTKWEVVPLTRDLPQS